MAILGRGRPARAVISRSSLVDEPTATPAPLVITPPRAVRRRRPGVCIISRTSFEDPAQPPAPLVMAPTRTRRATRQAIVLRAPAADTTPTTAAPAALVITPRGARRPGRLVLSRNQPSCLVARPSSGTVTRPGCADVAGVSDVLARGRAAAEALMTDTCVIRRRTGVTTDDSTGQTIDTWLTVYTGVCKIQETRAQGRRTDAGEVSVVVVRRELHLPVATSTGVQRGDEATITASTGDDDLVGRVLRVHDLAEKTYATARRLGVEEVT